MLTTCARCGGLYESDPLAKPAGISGKICQCDAERWPIAADAGKALCEAEKLRAKLAASQERERRLREAADHVAGWLDRETDGEFDTLIGILIDALAETEPKT